MIKLESKNMQQAIARAREVKSHVRCIGERAYEVTGSQGAVYTVRFVVVNNMKLAECNCPAGQREMLCRHVAAACALNIAIYSMRQAIKPPPAAETAILIKPQGNAVRLNGIDV